MSPRSNIIHVFDTSGHRLHACRLGKTDYSGPLPLRNIFPTPEGDVYIQDDSGWPPKPLIHFGPDGRLLKPLTLQPKSKIASRGSTRHAVGWSNFSDYLDFVDAHGQTLHTIARRPDGKWLDFPSYISTAPDNSIAVLDRTRSSEKYHVSLYSPIGEPKSGFTLPYALGQPTYTAPIAYNGHIVVVSAGGSLYGISPRGRFLWRFTPPPTGNDLRPFFIDHGRTLAVWTDGLHFEKYALPN